MKTANRKKKAAALLLSLYVLGNALVLGMLRVYRTSYDTMHARQLPVTELTQTDEAYVLSLLHYEASIPRSVFDQAYAVFRQQEVLLPCSLRLATSGCTLLLRLAERYAP